MKSKRTRFLGKLGNKPILFIASIIIAIIFSLPHLYGIFKLGVNYSPLQSTDGLAYFHDETYTYAPQIYQILKLRWQGDAYIWENRFLPSPFIGELASIIPITILSVITSVPYGFIISDLIFPPLLFLLIFFGLKSLGFNKSFSCAVSMAILVIPFLSLLIPKISSYGTQFMGSITDPLFFSRTPHPQISTIYLFTTLFLTAMVLKNATVKLVYLWAASIGLSLYASPYVSSTIFGALLLLSPFIFKKLTKKALMRTFLIVGIITLPWFINLFAQQDLLKSSDFLLRSTFPKELFFPRQLRFLTIAIAVFAFTKKESFSRILAIFMISGSLMVDGHQVIFGRNIEADHWLTRILAPLGTLGVLLIVRSLLERFKPNYSMKGTWSFIAIALLVLALTKQVAWIKSHAQLTQVNPHNQVLQQILSSTNENDVIGTYLPSLNNEIAAVTGRWVYFAPGDRTISSADEQIQRVCDVLNVAQIKNDSPAPDDQLLVQVSRYAIGLKSFNKEDLKGSIEELTRCLKEKPIGPRYRIDYIVVNDKTNEELRLVPLK